VEDNNQTISITLDTKPYEAGTKRVDKSTQQLLNTVRNHLNKIEQMNVKHSNSIELIETRKQARLDIIREQGLQKEIARMKRLESQAQQSSQTISRAFAALGALGVVGAGIGIGNSALDSAKSFDKIRAQLAGVTGSVDQANKKFAELAQVAQKSVGVTTTSATGLYAQFKVLGTVSDQSINSAIKAMGKLTTIFDVDDQRAFGRNVQQLFDQGFEKADIKEALGRIPIFNQLLQSAFGTSDPAKLRRLRDAGKLTNDQFVGGLFDAVNNDPRLKNIPETIGSRFDKVGDRARQALEPIGREIADFILPLFDKLIPLAEDFGKTLDLYLKSNQTEIARFRDSIVDLASAFTDLGKISIPVVSELVRVAANGVGFYADLGNAIRGDFSFKNSSKNWGNLYENNPTVTYGPDLGVSTTGAAVTSQQQIKRNVDAWLKRNGGGGGVGNDVIKRRSNISGSGGAVARSSKFRLPSVGMDDLDSSQFEGMDAYTAAELTRARRPGELALYNFRVQDRIAASDARDIELSRNTIDAQREALKNLEPVLSSSARFMKGLKGESDAVANSFERLGDSIGNAFGDVRNLFSGLKSAILGFFGSITSSVLRNVAGAALSPLFATTGGGAADILSGGGTYSQQSSIAQMIQTAVSGGGSYGGVIPGMNPTASGAGGGGILGKISSAIGGASGIAGLFAGGSVGSMFGGQSTAGRIAGGIGGAAVGLGLSYGASVFSAGGGLAAAGLAALGPAALIGAPLLIGSILLGKAKQRRADESVVDTYWVEYSRVLRELTGGVNSDSIMGDSALAQAAEARETAVGLIGQIKTKSVRESRLKNQIPQIDRVDLKRLQDAVAVQKTRLADNSALLKSRQDLDSRLVPEFASGGYIQRTGLAKVHAGEVIMNSRDQAASGVTGISAGSMRGGGSGSSSLPPITLINLLGTQQQDELFIRGAISRNTTGALLTGMTRAMKY
jgi:hypothetical protein